MQESTTAAVAGFSLEDDAVLIDPFDLYLELREQAPVIETVLGGKPCWVISRHEDITAVHRDTDTFSNHTTDIPWVLHSDPPEQQRLRKVVADMFTRNSIESMAPSIEQRIAELLPGILEAGECDIVEDFAAPLTVSVLAELLGITLDDMEKLRHLSHLMMESIRVQRTGAEMPEELQSARDELVRFALQIAQPGQHNEERVVARLVNSMNEGELSDEQYAYYVVLLLIAGHTTTTNLIANATYILIQRPENLARLRADPGFAPLFIEEVLRVRGSFQRSLRVTTREVEIAGVVIPAGANVCLLLGSANRDTDRIERADEFNPERRRAPHMSFGHGIHNCLGQWLARLESRTTFVALAERVASIELIPEREPVHQTEGTGNEFGFVTLPVRLTELEGAQNG